MIIITLLISIVSSYQIWQVTDVHFDGNYKEGSDPNTVCRSGEGTARKIGDYSCDTTDYVLKSVPKFINYQSSDKKHNKILIYNGDILPRKLGEYDEMYLKEGLDNATKFLKEFNRFEIIPMLGNHDALPENYQDESKSSLFRYAAKKYSRWLPQSALETFKRGGYYTKEILGTGEEEKTYVVVLNTVLYYTFNKLTENDTDPIEQFKWFKETMDKYTEENKKVIVAAHICPGVSERYNWSEQMYNQYDDKLIDLITQYSNITIGMICGHLHLDTYRIMQSKDKKKTVIGYLSPSLDTYLGINPSIRLYDIKGNIIQSYINYYVDLNKTDVQWKFNYNATQEYNLNDLSPNSMISLAQRMHSNRTLHDIWYEHMRGDSHMYRCDDKCWNNNLCALEHPRNSEKDCYKW
ncbi:sphingomyelin phosphodiesterase, putative [Entamoeba dispar SAW760]|uniref:Sphingomyelin phosphodiesterase, putative n=1 Tax=Entamoeba dispar (strain ATCC PRA-260 / SAW760) TaxID=370354 RepID=B0EAP0_ENTDS|nr:sphingomyelin phosphodiesterase, putative [Entamoeba dispar SAW760]EDR28389.1 sphingomyelin phosphodiesterase, putative [Entamoeba dispar SAW760]|eukprot:EDR28389.1 sphingomyelin phosphodiesterase, putative [Entamoeba dispar SAW760]